MRKKILLASFSVIALFCSVRSHATHLRAGEITAVRTSCTSLTFMITITVFLDTESGVTFGGNNDWLDFGDNGPNSRILVKEQQTIQRPDLGPYMGMASFSMEYTYSGFGTYTISYTEEFRNKDIVNIDNSGATKFYVETTIILDPFLSCNKSLPKLLVPPIDRACTGVAFFHNPGAVDLDGDSLSYAIVTPEQDFNTPVWNYKAPNDDKFYRNPGSGNESQNDPPSFSINSVDGTITWDAPGVAREYNIAFHIVEWRKSPEGIWQKMSIVRRDMQIIVEDCDNERPDLIVPNDTCVTAGTILKKTIYGTDPENDPVTIEIFSEVISLAVSPATYAPVQGTFQPSNPPAALTFKWNTHCEHVKEQFYQVVFKITDNPARGPSLVTFKTWRIKVVGPAPVWRDVKADHSNSSATLTWNDYACENAVQMQVWRKINGMTYTPDNCETGMPGFLGYDLIGTVLLTDPLTKQKVNQFVDTNSDKGLAPGAVYCYRIVAVYPDPKGGESYVSRDTCLTPIITNAPVITNVSVLKTHSSEGAIQVRWYHPLNIDRSKYPGPLKYAVYRGNGFDGVDVLNVTPDQLINDTTFIDTGINTKDHIFNYRVVLYSNTASDLLSYAAIDTSAVASSVRLEASAFPDNISLTWKAEVPWLNASHRFPYHLIYRGGPDNSPDDFLLIDSVSVTDDGFAYSDQGHYENTPLDKNATYCYRVLTRGVYGNRAIREPLENFSQVICIKPDEDGKPCAPVVFQSAVDCDALFATMQCVVNNFSNTIYWRSDCEDQVSSYRIYRAAGPDREFALLAENVRDTFYLDKNLPSFARCYKVTAVDNHGIESDRSEIICYDNCPSFELPNIFTPNGDQCNDHFSAYGPFNPLNQYAPESCALGNANYTKCVRFVQKVSVNIFNRWGKEVYNYRSGAGENSIYINWDGKAKDGTALSTGVYYYVARVTFDTLNAAQQEQTFKGWVHLLR